MPEKLFDRSMFAQMTIFRPNIPIGADLPSLEPGKGYIKVHGEIKQLSLPVEGEPMHSRAFTKRMVNELYEMQLSRKKM